MMILQMPQMLPELAGLSKYEMILSILVLVFGLLVIGGQILVMLKRQKGWGPSANQIVGITLVVTAGLFLITAGYSQDQIAPMVGLLGTIIGYLLGRSTEKTTQ